MAGKCISVTSSNSEIVDSLTSNSKETDVRIWFHCKYAYSTKKLIYFPDTDIYFIGLPFVCRWDSESGYDMYNSTRVFMKVQDTYLCIIL